MKAEFLAHTQSVDSFPKPSLPEVAFMGRSNVGKSSLINTLLAQKIARTSSTPGRTQGLVFFKVKPNLVFVDFPGFGYAKTSQTLRQEWAKIAEHYFETRRTLKKTCWIYDIRRDPDALDFQMREWLSSKDKPFFLIMTKCDVISRVDWEKRKKIILSTLELSPDQGLVFSSKTKEGLKTLWRLLEG